jgi:hypothetical protein
MRTRQRRLSLIHLKITKSSSNQLLLSRVRISHPCRYDTMKRRSITIVWKLFAFLFILMIAVFYLIRDNDVNVSDIKWECNNFKCSISFEVKNNNNYSISKNISIRAIKDEHSRYSSTSHPVGEKQFVLNLSSNVSKSID